MNNLVISNSHGDFGNHWRRGCWEKVDFPVVQGNENQASEELEHLVRHWKNRISVNTKTVGPGCSGFIFFLEK